MPPQRAGVKINAMLNDTEQHSETAVDLRFEPRKVPLLLLPFFYQHVFHWLSTFLLCISLCILIVKMAGRAGNDGGLAGEFRREVQTQWQPAGNAKVLKNIPFFTDATFITIFSETEFEYTAPNGKKRNDICGSFIHRFDAGKEYPLETMFDVFPRYRLTGTYSYFFFRTLSIFIFVGGIAFLYLLIILYCIRSGSRHMQLYRCGVAAVGTPAGTEEVFLLTRLCHFVRVFIEFQDEHGKKHRCRRLSSKEAMEKYFTEPLVLIYDDGKPERCLLVREFGAKTQYDWEKRAVVLSAGIKAYGWFMYVVAALVLAVIVWATINIVMC
ncbi:MAG: hypothetical protein LBH00_00275 [Planctomycetaceae bacterium]|nr:hypothetical protein [Planctomycetaceae bacterium]